jgi:hypothetical protein
MSATQIELQIQDEIDWQGEAQFLRDDDEIETSEDFDVRFGFALEAEDDEFADEFEGIDISAQWSERFVYLEY